MLFIYVIVIFIKVVIKGKFALRHVTLGTYWAFYYTCFYIGLTVIFRVLSGACYSVLKV